MDGKIHRAAFIGSSAAAVAAAAFLRSVALGAEVGQATAQLTPMVKTMLAFEADGFPAVRAEQLVARMIALFDLDGSLAFVSSLAAFSDVASFSRGNNALFTAERAATAGVDVVALAASDARAFSAERVAASPSYGYLDAMSRLRYVGLWQRSAFTVRRRFFNSLRAITFAAFYSMPEVWPSIGYAGPFVSNPR